MQGVIGLKAVANQQAGGQPQAHMKATFQAKNPQTNKYMIVGGIDIHNSTKTGTYRVGRTFRNLIGATAAYLWFYIGAGGDFASTLDPSVRGYNATVTPDNIVFDFQLTSNYTSESLLGNSVGLQISGGMFDGNIIRSTIAISSDRTTNPLDTSNVVVSPSPPPAVTTTSTSSNNNNNEDSSSGSSGSNEALGQHSHSSASDPNFVGSLATAVLAFIAITL